MFMPSAWKDKGGWIARFRGVDMPKGKYRQVRIPGEYLRPNLEDIDAANHADKCRRLCELIEAKSYSADDIREAVKRRAITKEMADRITKGLPIHIETTPVLSLLGAATMHPATEHERNCPEDYRRHQRDLEQFSEWSGVTACKDVTLDLVTRYVSHLKTVTKSQSTMQHKMLWLRRAMKVHRTRGGNDPLERIKIVSKRRTGAGRREIDVWGLDDLCRGAVALQQAENHRALAVVALGGFMGLRPSEITRAKIGDIEDGLLSTGMKTEESERILPIPKPVLKMIEPLLDGPASRALIPTHSPVARSNTDKHFDPRRGLRFFTDDIRNAAGGNRRPCDLRKSFMTWAVDNGIDPSAIERYMGHAAGLVSAVSSRHYYKALNADKLRPHCRKMEKKIEKMLQKMLQENADH